MYLEPRVAESTTSTGTGDLTLGGALTAYRAFSAAIGTNRPFVYSLEAVDANGVATGDWEVGVGYITASTNLVRFRVLRSSNSDAAVSLASGTKYVYVVDAGLWLGIERDDFTSQGLVTTGNVSNLSWAFASTGTLAFLNGVAGHPGILRIPSSATSGTIARFRRSSSDTVTQISPASVVALRWVVRLPAITSMAARIGLSDNWNSTTLGSNGIWFEYAAAASANWRYATRASATGTPVDSTLAVAANTWYELIMLVSSNAVAFFVNGNLIGTSTTNIPTAVLAIGAHIVPSVNTATNIDVDLYELYHLTGERF